MQESYKILGLTEDATDEEIDQAYKKLKDRYMRERFYEGEIGNDAAKNLTKLENAYSEIITDRLHSKKTEDNKKDYSKIKELLVANKISEAQEELDSYYDRDAEWHYYQAVIFYKKNWTNESKKQLEIAMQMDPNEKKYKEEYEKFEQKVNNYSSQFNSTNQTVNQTEGKQMGNSDCSGFIDCCTTWCCLELLCNGCCR